MISSRRLAREWALKILYQSDVGKMPIEESRASTLERMRRDFVQRSSRAASGSFLEERLTDAVSAHLVSWLTVMNGAMERAVATVIERWFSDPDAWTRLRVSFGFSRQSYSALLDTPRIEPTILLDTALAALSPLVLEDARIGPEERRKLLGLANWGRHAIPAAAVAAYTDEVRAARPDGANMKATLEYVQDRWNVMDRTLAERWKPAGESVKKQVADWLRVGGFMVRIVEGVASNRADLDAKLQELAIGWALDRQVSVDRNILRIAAFEMLFITEIPTSASINEAVELAKKFSTTESGRFVNGVLGTLASQIDRRDADAPTGGAEEDEIDADEIDQEEFDADDRALEEEIEQ